MRQKNYAVRVGFFVLVGLVLIAGLMLNFSRGVGLFQPKYEIVMRTRSVAGLKPSAAVFLSGVKIGNVESVELDPRSKGVTVRLTILKQFELYKDSRFVIEQQGVLGDQFVNITPGSAEAPLLKDGDEVPGDEPFNLLEVARSTSDLLKRFDQLGSTVGETIARVNRQVLDPQTLSNLSRTIGNFEKVSDHTLGVVDNVAGVISNSGPVLTMSLSNLLAFSRKLDEVAMKVDETIVTNRVELNESMHNLRDATASLKQMTAGIESGKGLVGALLKDEQWHGNISLTLSNLTVVSSNLARYGLLYKPKQPKETAPPAYSGKSPFK
ncbi:MAG TPA: MlaD family protein [Candidatus Limnocylindria bacterium]|nr:MlaD family protein [Candidatus Limnocylindria bacterium]